MIRTGGSARSSSRGRLPGEHFVGQALEGLAQHHQTAGFRVAGAEVQVGQQTLAPPMTPFGGENHQVKRVPGLHLDPLTAPAPGPVWRVKGLHHDAFVAVGDRVGEESLGLRPDQR